MCGGCWRMDMHRRGCMLSFLLRASFSSFSPSPTSPPPASLSLSRARGHSRRTHHPRWGKGGWVVACVRVGAARVLLSTFQHAICAHRLFLLWCNKTGLLLPRGSVTSSNVSSAAVLQKRERERRIVKVNIGAPLLPRQRNPPNRVQRSHHLPTPCTHRAKVWW